LVILADYSHNRAEKTGQSEGVATVGFDPVRGALRNEGRTHDFADDVSGAEMTAEGKPGGTSLIDVANLGGVLEEPFVELVEGGGMGRNVPVGTGFTGGIGEGHSDGFRVDIKSDVLNGFLRG
jgi:hypothetical protein